MLNLRDGIRADGRLLEEEYLALETNRLIEFDSGAVEALPQSTDRHQAILASLFLALRAYAEKEDGIVRFASLRLRLWSGKYREPDTFFIFRRAVVTCEENASGKAPIWSWRSSASGLRTGSGIWLQNDWSTPGQEFQSIGS